MKTNYCKNDLKYKYTRLISKVNKAFIRFLTFILLISLCITKQIRKLSSSSYIIIKVEAQNYASILSINSVIKNPDRIYVNGEEIHIPPDFQSHKQIPIQNNVKENEISMEFFWKKRLHLKNYSLIICHI
jgi:hypothetical protein